MNVSQRDIILINFPFSDLTGTKVRPALVVSNDRYSSTSLDAVVLAITSNLSPSEYKVFIENRDLEKCQGLQRWYVYSCFRSEHFELLVKDRPRLP